MNESYKKREFKFEEISKKSQNQYYNICNYHINIVKTKKNKEQIEELKKKDVGNKYLVHDMINLKKTKYLKITYSQHKNTKELNKLYTGIGKVLELKVLYLTCYTTFTKSINLERITQIKADLLFVFMNNIKAKTNNLLKNMYIQGSDNLLFKSNFDYLSSSLINLTIKDYCIKSEIRCLPNKIDKLVIMNTKRKANIRLPLKLRKFVTDNSLTITSKVNLKILKIIYKTHNLGLSLSFINSNNNKNLDVLNSKTKKNIKFIKIEEYSRFDYFSSSYNFSYGICNIVINNLDCENISYKLSNKINLSITNSKIKNIDFVYEYYFIFNNLEKSVIENIITNELSVKTLKQILYRNNIYKKIRNIEVICENIVNDVDKKIELFNFLKEIEPKIRKKKNSFIKVNYNKKDILKMSVKTLKKEINKLEKRKNKFL